MPFQNPESARNNFGPVAPARTTSRDQLLDEPQRSAGRVRGPLPRADVHHLAGPGASREDRVIAAPDGCTRNRRPACHTHRPRRRTNRDPRQAARSPGPAPAAHARPQAVSQHLVELSDVPESERPQERSQPSTVPPLHAPSTALVCPERNTSQSSMQSAPSAHRDTNVMTLRPGFAAPTRSPRFTVPSIRASIPSRSASTAGNSTPAFATDPLIIEHDP